MTPLSSAQESRREPVLTSANEASSSRASAHLEVYGLRAAIEGDWPEAVDAVRLDFAWFARPASYLHPDVRIVIRRRRPDFESLGEPAASFITPRNVVYQQGSRTIIDYFGRAISVLDRSSSTLVVEGEDQHLVHEAAYHFLVSRVGQHLEARGLARLHALGLSAADGAIAIMFPSGGGKSTLALRALLDPRVQLLSDDSPVVDRRGFLHPFPLRIGINESDAASLPSRQVRRIERMEFHPKLALDLQAFADRVAGGPRRLSHIVLGRRTLGSKARLEPESRRSALMPLVRESVVGVGLYQGMEFLLQRGTRDVLRQVRPAATRTACCAAALAGARVWRLTVGRDPAQNWEALEPLLE